jgi:hypothetical protein
MFGDCIDKGTPTLSPSPSESSLIDMGTSAHGVRFSFLLLRKPDYHFVYKAASCARPRASGEGVEVPPIGSWAVQISAIGTLIQRLERMVALEFLTRNRKVVINIVGVSR